MLNVTNQIKVRIPTAELQGCHGSTYLALKLCYTPSREHLFDRFGPSTLQLQHVACVDYCSSPARMCMFRYRWECLILTKSVSPSGFVPSLKLDSNRSVTIVSVDCTAMETCVPLLHTGRIFSMHQGLGCSWSLGLA